MPTFPTFGPFLAFEQATGSSAASGSAIPASRPWSLTLGLGVPVASGSIWLVPLGSPGTPVATLSLDAAGRPVLQLPKVVGSEVLRATLSAPGAGLPGPGLDVVLPGVPPPEPPSTTLTVLHTTDTYGVFDPVGVDLAGGRVDLHKATKAGGKTRLAAAIARQRAAAPGGVLLLSAGNELGPDAAAAVDSGKRVVEVMNLLGYDAWSPSTYDFAYGLKPLHQRIAGARFPVVSSNVRLKDGSYLGDRYRTFTRNGLKIAVLGVADPRTADLLPAKDREQVTFEDPVAAVTGLVPGIRAAEHPDLVICLAHLPEATIRKLLLPASGVDTVLGGFSSHRSEDLSLIELKGLGGKRAYSPGGYGVTLGADTFDFDPPRRTAADAATASVPVSFRMRGAYVDNVLLDHEDAQETLAVATGSSRAVTEAVARVVAQAHEAYVDTWRDRLGVVLALKEELPARSAERFVAEAMRLRAGTELAVVSNGFFLDSGDFGPVADVETLYADMPWDEDLVAVTLSGKQLVDLVERVQGDGTGLVAGFDVDHGVKKVNGHKLDPDGYYSVVTLSSLVSADDGDFEVLARADGRQNLAVSARLAVLDVLRDRRYGLVCALHPDQVDAVGLDDFPDYSAIPFWKTTLTMDLDFQSHAVSVDPRAYPDLSWNNDQPQTSWGGELLYRWGATWGPNEVDGKGDADFQQTEVGSAAPRTTTDTVQLEANAQRDLDLLPITTWTGLDLYTRFHQTDPVHPFWLGQLSAGLSQQLPLGIRLREGLSYRKLFFDSLDRFGALFRLEWQKAFPWLVVDTTLDVFGKPNVNQEGVLTDLEAKVTIPLTSWVGLSVKESWYDDSMVAAPATRTLVGLSFDLIHPWVPTR